jgi:hypothetical protein
MAITRDLKSLGRTVAELEEAALATRVRPSIEDRCALLEDALKKRGLVRKGASRRGRIAIGVAFAALVAAVPLWPHRETLQFAISRSQAVGVVGVWIMAPAAVPTTIHLSDGTRIVLEKGESKMLSCAPSASAPTLTAPSSPTAPPAASSEAAPHRWVSAAPLAARGRAQ